MPARVGGIEPGRAALLAADPEILQPSDGLAGERRRALRIEGGDDPGADHRSGGDGPLAFADEQLKPAPAILGRRDRDRARRKDGDIAAIGRVEHTETAALEA